MHEPPLRQLVVFEVDSAVVYRVEDVLHPRHEQPYDGAFFVGYGLDYRLGVGALEQDAFAARYEAAEPVHLRAGVVERRYAEEYVVVRLPVVGLLDLRGVHERAVRVEYRLREACGAGGEVYRRVVVVGEQYARRVAREVRRKVHVVFREARAAVADEEAQLDARYLVADVLDAADELGAEEERVDVGELEAVFNLFRGVAEVERHGERARLEYSEVERQPFEAVHHEDGDLVALLDSAREQQVRAAVGLFVEDAPCYLAAVAFGRAGFYELVFLPRDAADFLDFGVDFDERRLVAEFVGVPLKQVGNRHTVFLLKVFFLFRSGGNKKAHPP